MSEEREQPEQQGQSRKKPEASKTQGSKKTADEGRVEGSGEDGKGDGGNEQDKKPAQKEPLEVVVISAPTIETKLEDIKQQIAESTLAILRTLSLSEAQRASLRDKLAAQTSGSIDQLQGEKGALAAIKESLKDASGDVDKGLLLDAQREMTNALNQWRVTQEGMSDAFTQFKGTQADLKETQEEMLRAFNRMTGVQQRLLTAQESQLPRALQIPTREVVAMQKLKRDGVDLEQITWNVVEARAKSMELQEYEKEVRAWYKRTIREIGKFNVQFEERPQILSPLLLAVTHLELDPETRALGEELRKDLDAHRIDKGLARVWDIALPDQIGGAASQMHISTLKVLFTSGEDVIDPKTGKKKLFFNSKWQPEIDEKTGEQKIEKRYRVAEKFRELEKKGNDIGQLNDQINELKVEERIIAEQRDKKGRYKNLTADEQRELKNLVETRRKLENQKKKRVTEINESYRDGGGVKIIKGSMLEATLKDKGEPVPETIPITEGVKELERQRAGVVKQIAEIKETFLEKPHTASEPRDEKKTKEVRDYKLRRLEGLRAKEREYMELTDEDKDLLKNLETEFRELVPLLETIDTIDREHEDLEDDRQAMITAGGIHRYSFRSARQDISYLTGNFFSSRALHLASRVEDRYPLTKGIINPIAGKYKGVMFNFGGQDFMENLFLGKAKVQEEGIPKTSEGPDVREALTKRVKDKKYLAKFHIKLTKKSNGKDGINLEDTEFENPELWDKLLTDYEVVDNWYVADQIDEYTKIDKESRAVIWKDGSYWQDPNIDSFLSQRGTMTHMSQDEKKAFFGEEVDRTIEWYKHDKFAASEAVEDLEIFPEGEKYMLVEEASKAEMITNAFRDKMFTEHLDFPGFGSPRDKAQMKIFFDNLLAAWRWKPMRNQIALDSFWNLLKKMFGYAFSDEVGGR